MRRTALALALSIISFNACGETPSAPSRTSKPTRPWLQVSCTVAPIFRCAASLHGEGNVTAAATWSAAESFRLAGDSPITASTAVEFPFPGEPQVLRPANVYIRADYVSPTWGRMREFAPYAYAVDPGGVPVPLAYLSGFAGGLADVTVEIIEGEGAGKRDVTRSNGYYMIEFLRLNAPFTARASKPGYLPDVKTHPGIVGSPTGYPSNTSLHFSLNRAQ